jgi:hypothetical protein
MKKMIVTLAIAMITPSAFAGEENVNSKVLNAFNTEFKTATDVEWTTGDNFYRAHFVYNSRHLFAFYNADGELLGLTRYISPLDLSLNLQMDLKKQYCNYWVSDLFEVSKNEGTNYYATVENAGMKIVLKSSDGNTWSVFQKTKKA